MPCVHVALGDDVNFGIGEVVRFEHNALAAFKMLIPVELVSGYGRYFHSLLVLLCTPRFCLPRHKTETSGHSDLAATECALPGGGARFALPSLGHGGGGRCRVGSTFWLEIIAQK